ncbi:MAG: hypothetical protein R2844_12030 [Caldilineales bacterium]
MKTIPDGADASLPDDTTPHASPEDDRGAAAPRTTLPAAPQHWLEFTLPGWITPDLAELPPDDVGLADS